MATEHDKLIVDADSFFEIDPTTRAIKNTSTKKVKLMQFDHNSERFSFGISRFVDGHDMSESDRVEIHFTNEDLKTKETSKDRYIVEDLAVNPENEEEVVFTWLISNIATMYAGTLAFSIRFLCLDGEKILYSWNSDKSEGVSVGESCKCDDKGGVDIDNVDVLEAWKSGVVDALTAHQNNEDEEVAHIHFLRITAVEVHHLALNLINSSNPNKIAQGSFGVGAGIEILRGQSLGVGLSKK